VVNSDIHIRIRVYPIRIHPYLQLQCRRPSAAAGFPRPTAPAASLCHSCVTSCFRLLSLFFAYTIAYQKGRNEPQAAAAASQPAMRVAAVYMGIRDARPGPSPGPGWLLNFVLGQSGTDSNRAMSCPATGCATSPGPSCHFVSGQPELARPFAPPRAAWCP
jgi:hypothetical protein